METLREHDTINFMLPWLNEKAGEITASFNIIPPRVYLAGDKYGYCYTFHNESKIYLSRFHVERLDSCLVHELAHCVHAQAYRGNFRLNCYNNTHAGWFVDCLSELAKRFWGSKYYHPWKLEQVENCNTYGHKIFKQYLKTSNRKWGKGISYDII